jgi:hypothetical protein
VTFGDDVPLVDDHELEQGDEGADDVVEVVVAVAVAVKYRVLKTPTRYPTCGSFHHFPNSGWVVINCYIFLTTPRLDP